MSCRDTLSGLPSGVTRASAGKVSHRLLIVVSTLALIAGVLVAGSDPAQAATFDCNAGTQDELTACFNRSDTDVMVTLTGSFTANTRLNVAGMNTRSIDLAGFALTASAGVGVPAGTFIVDDSVGTGTLRATGDVYQAAIGGTNSATGRVIINGGTVTATGTTYSAGIGGGGNKQPGGTVTINGGTVSATGGANSAGIGGARGGTGGTVTINGGDVTAIGGADGGAGIGGSLFSASTYGNAGATVVINGGHVKAKGGEGDYPGPGIGSGGSHFWGVGTGSLTVTGQKDPASTQTTGGLGSSSAVVPDISFGSSGPNVLVTPWAGVTGPGSVDITVLAPTFSATPDPVVFDSQQVGTTSSEHTVTVTNNGGVNLTINVNGVSTSGTDASQFGIAGGTCVPASNPVNVPPGSSCTVKVTFAPMSAGSKSASLAFATNLDPASQTVALTGAGAGTALVISQVDPASGPAAGGTSVTITGAGFDPVTGVVSVGGAACVIAGSPAPTATRLVCISGAHGAGVADVVVTNGDHQAVTRAGGFTYLEAPVVPVVSTSAITFAGSGSIMVPVSTGSGVSAVQYRTKVRGAADYGSWVQVSGVAAVQIPVNTRTGTWVQVRSVGAGGTSATVLLLVQASGISIEASERGDVTSGCVMPKLRSMKYLKSGKAQLKLVGSVRCLKVRSTATASRHYSAWKVVKKRTVLSVRLRAGTVGHLQIRAGTHTAKIALFIPHVI